MVARRNPPHGSTSFHGPDFQLTHFFEDFYRPLQLRHCRESVVSIYRASLRWFARALNRPPRMSDLNRETVAAFLGALAECGLQQTRVREIRKRLLAIWSYAHQRGLALRYEPPSTPEIMPLRRPWLDNPPADGSILGFYRQTFRPALVAKNAKASLLTTLDCAVTHFHDFTGASVGLADVTESMVTEFGL